MSGQFHGAALDCLKSSVTNRFGDSQAEPWRRVTEGESPDTANNLLSTLDCADTLGFHRMTYGDVPLDCERRQTQRRRVDTWRKNQTSVVGFIIEKFGGT